MVKKMFKQTTVWEMMSSYWNLAINEKRQKLFYVCNKKKNAWDGYITAEAKYLFPSILWQALLYSSLTPGNNLPDNDIVLIISCQSTIRSQTGKTPLHLNVSRLHF